MPKKKLTRSNSSTGAGPLPLRRSYEREAVGSQRGKYPDPQEVRPQDRTTSKEAMELTTKTKPKPEDYDLTQWRKAALITLSTDEAELANRENYLLPIRNPDGSLSFDLLAEAERMLYSGKPKNAPLEKRREAAAIIARIAGGEGRLAPYAVEASEATEEVTTSMKLSDVTNEQVEAYMEQHSISDFGLAVRQMAADPSEAGLSATEASQADTTISPGVDIDQENRELREALKERAALEDDYADTVKANRVGGIHNGGYRGL